MIKSLPLFAAALLVAAPSFAQADVVLTPTADTWLRSDNAKSNNSTSTKLEIRTEASGKDFVTVLVFSAPTVPDGYEIESATLRVTTERIKDKGAKSTNLFAITGEIEETGAYATYETQITAARDTDPIATFELAGLNGKSVGSDAISDENYKTIDKWQNTIDVTTYVKSITTETFGFLFSAAATGSNSNNIFSKEATTAKLEGVTAADLIPQLTVTFKEAAAPVDPTAIKDITSDDAAAPTFNLLGQKVNSNYKGVVIRGGKKFIQK